MKRVFIEGNISLDLILGEIDDFPGWGIELIIPGYTMRPGGQASNVVLALGNLSVPVYAVGTIGQDSVGQDIRSSYKKWGVGTDYLFTLPSVPTGLSVAVTNSKTHERTFLTELGAQSEITVKLLEEVYPSIQDGDIFLICGYFLSNKLRTGELVAFLQKLKTEKPTVILLLDTGWPPEGWIGSVKKEVFSLLPFIDYFLPNQLEIDNLTEHDMSKVFRKWNGTLVVKMGKEGCRVITSHYSFRIPTFQVEVKDTIGAGDYFNAGFILGLWKGYELAKSVQLANIIASLNISLDARREILARPEDVERLLERATRP